MKFTQLLSYSARLFLCLIVISLLGCEKEIEEIDKHSLDSSSDLRSQVTSLYELESNTKLMNALSKITSNDITTERNEVLQGIVVDSSYVKQIETEAFVFYTMFVYPNEPQDDLNKFKNLLAKEDKNGDDIDFYMIEYAPNSSLQYTAADGGSIIIPGDGEIYLDFIGSNNETNSTGMLDNCTFTADICINTKQGGIGPPHVKGPGCTDQSKIYTFSWSMCNLGENPGDENPADYLDLSFTDGETSVGGSRRTVPPYIGVPEEDPDLATEPVNLYVQNNFVNNLEPELKNWWDFTAADDQQKQEQKDAIEAFLLEHLDSSQPNGFEPEAEAFAKEYIRILSSLNHSDIDIQSAIASGVTTTAEYVHELYMELADLVNQNPQYIGYANYFVDHIRDLAEMVVDINPETCSWVDLTNMWLFELGDNPIQLSDTDYTTEVLKNLEGVEQARSKAELAIQNDPNTELVFHQWVYGQEAFYDGMSEGNLATSFLGTYSIDIEVTHISGNQYQLDFHVHNKSSWESATRLRIDNDHNGSHDGIIPSKERGEGINFGGDFEQDWNWSETVTID